MARLLERITQRDMLWNSQRYRSFVVVVVVSAVAIAVASVAVGLVES